MRLTIEERREAKMQMLSYLKTLGVKEGENTKALQEQLQDIENEFKGRNRPALHSPTTLGSGRASAFERIQQEYDGMPDTYF